MRKIRHQTRRSTNVPTGKNRRDRRQPAVALALFPPGMIVAADAPPANTNWIFEATNHLGQWIWDTNTFDKQTCRFWRAFAIPDGAKVASAILRITVDNGYSLFLDGREIGRGSDWRTVTEYDVDRKSVV